MINTQKERTVVPHLVFITDENYAMPTTVAAVSALRAAASSPLRLTVALVEVASAIADCLSKALDSYAQRMHNIQLISLNTNLLTQFSLKSGLRTVFSPAIYGPIVLPEIIDDSFLYVDSDVLIRGSLKQLFDDYSPLPAHVFLGAATDAWTPTVGGEHGVRGFHELGLESNTPYFNSGVLLIDSDRWRNADVTTNTLKHLSDHDSGVVAFDQEALNAIVGGKFHVLPPQFNTMNYWRFPEHRVGEHVDVLDRSVIRHFEGRRKPWLRPHASLPHFDEWFAIHSLLADKALVTPLTGTQGGFRDD